MRRTVRDGYDSQRSFNMDVAGHKVHNLTKSDIDTLQHTVVGDVTVVTRTRECHDGSHDDEFHDSDNGPAAHAAQIAPLDEPTVVGPSGAVVPPTEVHEVRMVSSGSAGHGDAEHQGGSPGDANVWTSMASAHSCSSACQSFLLIMLGGVHKATLIISVDGLQAADSVVAGDRYGLAIQLYLRGIRTCIGLSRV